MAKSHQRRLNPGEPGTKKFLKKYGERLVCVRYKYDITKKERLRTIELVVDREAWEPKNERIPGTRIVAIRIGFDEVELRSRVKTLGGRWDVDEKVWWLPFEKVKILGLELRMV